MTLSRFRRRAFQQLVSLTLLFTSLFANAVGVASALNAQRVAVALAQYDIGIICTGGQFRYISLSLYEQTGEIVYLEAPAGDSSPHYSFTCATSYNIDKEDVLFSSGAGGQQPLPVSQHIVEFYRQPYIEQRPHSQASVRAPPFRLIFS